MLQLQPSQQEVANALAYFTAVKCFIALGTGIFSRESRSGESRDG